jgi:hypothetical protein
VKSKGVFAVAILGTRTLDVTTIDPASIKIFSEDNPRVGAPPIRWSFEDVAGGDGYLDLVFHFDEHPSDPCLLWSIQSLRKFYICTPKNKI